MMVTHQRAEITTVVPWRMGPAFEASF